MMSFFSALVSPESQPLFSQSKETQATVLWLILLGYVGFWCVLYYGKRISRGIAKRMPRLKESRQRHATGSAEESSLRQQLQTIEQGMARMSQPGEAITPTAWKDQVDRCYDDIRRIYERLNS